MIAAVVLLCGSLAVAALPLGAAAPTDGTSDVAWSAAQSSSGVAEDVVVGEGETVRGDLTATAGDVIVHGTVEGDVEAAAGSVVVTGEVTGNVEAAAGSVTIEGRVGDGVEAAAGSVDVAEGATVGDDVRAAAGTAAIDGTVEGDVQASETVRLGPEAAVTGDVEYGESVDRADGATVRGTVSQSDVGWSGPNVGLTPGPGSILLSAYWGIATLLLGGALLAVAPEFSADVASQVADEPFRAGGAGVAALIGVPSVLGVLLMSIVGIPLALAGGALFGFALWIGLVYGAYAVATAGLAAFDARNRWAALGIGVVGVEAVSLVPLAGGLLQLVVLVIGLGAGALAIAERRRDDGDGPTPDADLRSESGATV